MIGWLEGLLWSSAVLAVWATVRLIRHESADDRRYRKHERR